MEFLKEGLTPHVPSRLSLTYCQFLNKVQITHFTNGYLHNLLSVSKFPITLIPKMPPGKVIEIQVTYFVIAVSRNQVITESVYRLTRETRLTCRLTYD